MENAIIPKTEKEQELCEYPLDSTGSIYVKQEPLSDTDDYYDDDDDDDDIKTVQIQEYDGDSMSTDINHDENRHYETDAMKYQIKDEYDTEPEEEKLDDDDKTMRDGTLVEVSGEIDDQHTNADFSQTSGYHGKCRYVDTIRTLWTHCLNIHLILGGRRGWLY